MKGRTKSWVGDEWEVAEPKAEPLDEEGLRALLGEHFSDFGGPKLLKDWSGYSEQRKRDELERILSHLVSRRRFELQTLLENGWRKNAEREVHPIPKGSEILHIQDFAPLSNEHGIDFVSVFSAAEEIAKDRSKTPNQNIERLSDAFGVARYSSDRIYEQKAVARAVKDARNQLARVREGLGLLLGHNEDSLEREKLTAAEVVGSGGQKLDDVPEIKAALYYTEGKIAWRGSDCRYPSSTEPPMIPNVQLYSIYNRLNDAYNAVANYKKLTPARAGKEAFDLAELQGLKGAERKRFADQVEREVQQILNGEEIKSPVSRQGIAWMKVLKDPPLHRKLSRFQRLFPRMHDGYRYMEKAVYVAKEIERLAKHQKDLEPRQQDTAKTKAPKQSIRGVKKYASQKEQDAVNAIRDEALEISTDIQAAINTAAPSLLTTYRELANEWGKVLGSIKWSYTFTFPEGAALDPERAKAPKAQAPESPKEAGQDLAAKVRAFAASVGGEAGASALRAADKLAAIQSARAAQAKIAALNPALAGKLGKFAAALEDGAKP